MGAVLNHVSVRVEDLAAAERFYIELFGLERLPTPTFDAPVLWLGAGALQVHLYERPGGPAPTGHFALTVDDLERVYRQAEQTGVLEVAAVGPSVNVLPGGEAQFYVSDPSGNRVEVNHPEAARWRDTIPMIELAAVYVQREPGNGATLFHER